MDEVVCSKRPSWIARRNCPDRLPRISNHQISPSPYLIIRGSVSIDLITVYGFPGDYTRRLTHTCLLKTRGRRWCNPSAGCLGSTLSKITYVNYCQGPADEQRIRSVRTARAQGHPKTTSWRIQGVRTARTQKTNKYQGGALEDK
jgi:hypothetical protein